MERYNFNYKNANLTKLKKIYLIDVLNYVIMSIIKKGLIRQFIIRIIKIDQTNMIDIKNLII